jgi:hypothetical protein
MRHSKDDLISVPSLATCNDRLLYRTRTHSCYCSSSCSRALVLSINCIIHRLVYTRTKMTIEYEWEKLVRSFFSCCHRRLFAQNQLSRCNFIFSIFFDDVVASYYTKKRRTRHSVRMCTKYWIVSRLMLTNKSSSFSSFFFRLIEMQTEGKKRILYINDEPYRFIFCLFFPLSLSFSFSLCIKVFNQ